MEGARCMLLDAGLGNEFRGYAVLAAAHIINRMPSRAQGGKSPFETWTREKPTVGHLRVFGCPAHVLIPAETRRKLDRKSARCIFIGYAEDQGTRVYKLYNETTGRVITSRDVVFDENVKTTINGGCGVVEEMQRLEENTQENTPMKTVLSQHMSREGPRDLLSQLPSNKNYKDWAEDTYDETPTEPTSTTHEDSNNDDMEDTITLRPPATTTPNTQLPRRRQESMPNAEEPARGNQRPQRTRKPIDLFKPAAWKALVARTTEEPRSLAEALASSEARDWKEAWDSEVESLEANGTWVLEELPADREPIGCRWIFKKKEDGRFKARLVAKGYSQHLGIDYQETYAPVAKFTTLRILLSLVNENDWELDGMDVKTAFLHRELEETIYMDIPEGILPNHRAGDTSRMACRLIKTI